jgi:hypothetical protein
MKKLMVCSPSINSYSFRCWAITCYVSGGLVRDAASFPTCAVAVVACAVMGLTMAATARET